MNLKHGLLLFWIIIIGILPSLQAQNTTFDWLDDVLTDNCCLNQTVTAYDFDAYSFVYIKANENCANNGKLFFEDGQCWCEDKGDTFCLDYYGLTPLAGEVIYDCGNETMFSPFDQFDWLDSVVNTENCEANPAISVYLRDGHYYIFVEDQNGLGQLYYDTGAPMCTSQENFDCVALYGFSNETSSWTCGDDGQSNEVNVTLRNTLQDPNEDEVTYASLFGQADDAFDEFAIFSNSDVEFPTALAQTGTPAGDISGLYEIDLTDNSIEFSVLPGTDDPFWSNVFGLFPEGKFDRYYFTFSEPHNITSASSNHTSVNLRIVSETVIVVEVSEGYDLQPGVSFFISLNMAEELTNEEKARAFNTGLINGDPSVIKWIRNDYIQHNLGVPDGKAPISGFYGGQPTGITVDVHRSFEVGDYVFAQTTLGGTWGQFFGSGTDNILFEVWRFENGFAVEHWDNIVAVVDDGDGTTQTDGVTTPVTDLESTDANQALLEEMSQTLFVNGDWTNVRDYFDLDNYVQHSVGAGPDGAFLASLEGQTGVSFYDDVKFIYTLGNFGLVMSQGPDITGQDLDNPYAYYDLFRMDNGKIVEHWDAIQMIPPQDQWAHNNGKWGDDAINPTGDIEVILRNTLQDPNEDEVTYASLFGQADDAFDEFAIFSNSEVEFPTALAQTGTPAGDISGLYEIDLTDNSIEFNVLPGQDDPFWSNVFGLFPEGKFDRYYFTFSEPHNITSASSNHTSVNLRIVSETVVVVEISEGYDLQPGVSFFISLNMAEELTNEEKARAFNTGLINGDPSVIKWIRNDYIQHNLGVPDGKAPISGFYGGQPTGITVDVHRSFEVGDYVFAQTTLGGTWGQFFGSGTDNILFEVWRFENGFAVEHWDNIVAVVDDGDGTTQTDGVTTPVTDLESTDANQALLEEMSQMLFVNGDWTNVRDYFDLDNYVQHSVGAGPDGAFLASLEGQTGVSFYDDVKFIYTLGNFGLVMSQGPDITGQDLDNPYAYYDLFRMENGKIVEHWDAIQMIPPQDQWAHENGKW